MSTSPTLQSKAYIVAPEQIGFSFTYPPDYVEAIDLIQQVMEGHEGGLGIWLLRSEASVRLAKVLSSDIPAKKLVPFARFDNGDWVALFDADQPGKIFVTNLGDSPSTLYEQEERTLADFFRGVCQNLDLSWPVSEPSR